jgi:hypothetical protein
VKKIAQTEAQSSCCQNYCIKLAVLKSSPKFGLLLLFLSNLLKVINRPIGKNSPNLVTLNLPPLPQYTGIDFINQF